MKLVAVAIPIMVMCVVVLLFALKDDQTSPEAMILSVAMDSTSSTLDESVDSEPTRYAPEPPVQTSQSDFESLQHACPDMRVEMSDECFASLDEYFMDSLLPMFVFRYNQVLHVESQPTFERIFADPTADRDHVVAALNDERCRLENGPVQTELRESCHATSIVNHALFNRYCWDMHGTFYSDWFEPLGKFEGASHYQQARDQLEALHWENLDDYRLGIQKLNERMYRDAWLHLKCAQFGTQVRQPLNLWPAILDSKEKHVSETYAHGTTDWSEDAKFTYQDLVLGEEYKRLLAISARLGDEWAMTDYFRRELGDEDFMNSVKELRPWLPPLRETIKLRIPRVTLLTHAVQALLIADQDGVNIDKELLTKIVCEERDSAVDCESAFEGLEQVDLSTHERRIADELRRIHLELEPESKCFDEQGKEVTCGYLPLSGLLTQ